MAMAASEKRSSRKGAKNAKIRKAGAYIFIQQNLLSKFCAEGGTYRCQPELEKNFVRR
jgi:hypothetical protein